MVFIIFINKKSEIKDVPVSTLNFKYLYYKHDVFSVPASVEEEVVADITLIKNTEFITFILKYYYKMKVSPSLY